MHRDQKKGDLPVKPKDFGTVLVVDDDPVVLQSIRLMLQAFGCAVIVTDNAQDAFLKIRGEKIDIVITDIRMPGGSGIDLLDRIRHSYPDMPVILLTAYAELETAIEAVKKGAFDFITKPYKQELLLHAIKRGMEVVRLKNVEKNYRTLLEEELRKKTDEFNETMTMLKKTSFEIIQRLVSLAEFRDADRRYHNIKVGMLAGTSAQALALSEDFIDMITVSSQMHDIGKALIPERILFKEGKCTREEFAIIQSHTTEGAKVLSGSSWPTIRMAETIALSHHEQWGGGGYPKGLKGNDIPIEGRIVLLADQYDALRNKRPFREPFSHREAVRIITQGDERTHPGHFDPDVLQAFISVAPAFDSLYSA